MKSLTGILLLLCCLPSVAFGLQIDKSESKPADKDKTQTIESFSENKNRFDGFFPYYWDAQKGKIYLEVSPSKKEFLYVHSLATGLGSNPVGLDRGQLGDQKVVRFKRIGPKVLLIQRNSRFRALTDNHLERRAVAQSFAQSVIWGGKIEAESAGTYVIDITDLLLSDIHNVIGTLKRSDQGDFSLDKNRSAMFLDRCKSFPKNTELEATLTFSTKKPGSHVRQTAPTANSVSLRQHHSFIELPDDGYRPRQYDVRSPSIFITFADYATPLDQPLEKRWITRHRLIKKNPEDAVSEPIEPIVYYVDAGAPKQIQEALIEGARWWDEAFEAAGFKNAFQVKLLPPDADPLDVRFNVIQWVHRSTRGWSYGGSVIDPRTGEILKGHVTLGSLRVRQDQLLVNSINQPAGISSASCGAAGIVEESTLADLAVDGNALEVALARIRQLSAHEVGHTLGFVHNFAASTYADRASVMDYPAPRVKLTDNNEIDLSDAYGVGIGAWDIVSVQFAYSQFKTGVDEAKALDQILTKARQEKMLFVSDSDSRPASAAHPAGNLWDNGSDPLDELKHVMKVRQIAMDRFDPGKLPQGTTTADIGQYLTPLYLHHRYQLQAVGKLMGGRVYEFGHVGDSISPNKMVADEVQKRAVLALLDTMSVENLQLDRKLVQSISPRPYSSIRDQEIVSSNMGRVFDPLAAAKIATDMTLNELFQYQRLNRLVDQQGGDFPTPDWVFSQMIASIYFLAETDDNSRAILEIQRERLVDHMMNLVDQPGAHPGVRSAALKGLRTIESCPVHSKADLPFKSMIQRKIRRFLDRPTTTMPKPQQLKSPPGSPIGAN